MSAASTNRDSATKKAARGGVSQPAAGTAAEARPHTPKEPVFNTSREQDHYLITALKAGDQLAFQRLIEKYQGRVYSHCLRMVNDDAESYDLSQEVFIKVYRSIHKYEHTYSFYTWLYRITDNCCIDFMRKRRRQPQGISLSPGFGDDSMDGGREQDIPDSTFVPEKTVMNTELKGILREAINGLSEKLRTIIILKEIEGLSYEEISGILNCSRGTVKSRLFRAREKLKVVLLPYVSI